MTVTLRDIAERVGRSVPTVSRALAGHEDISLQTRREVQRVAAELGYVPNRAARNLRQQRSRAIGLVMPTADDLRFSDPFFSEFLSGVVEQTTARDYTVSISADGARDELDPYHRKIRSRSVDGFIVVRTRRQDTRIDLLSQSDIPFVTFGRIEGDNDFHLIDEDDTRGLRLIMDHLIGMGHTRIGFVAEPLWLTKSFHRLGGYQSGLEAHGIVPDADLLVETNFRQRAGRGAAQQLLNLPEPPTAIAACNDLLALGAIHEAQSRGLEVGRDLSITGYDNIVLAGYSNPPLTTVEQPAHRLGQLVARRLLRLIHDEPIDERQTILEPELIVRQSSGPCP